MGFEQIHFQGALQLIDDKPTFEKLIYLNQVSDVFKFALKVLIYSLDHGSIQTLFRTTHTKIIDRIRTILFNIEQTRKSIVPNKS